MLLTRPEALWNVLVINGSWRLAMRYRTEPAEYQTPLAQFIRGICSTIISQRANTTYILDELKERLKISENESLFDDRQFNKSRTYHWIIATCHDLCASIQTNIKFLHDYQTHRLPEIQAKANEHERLGLDYWIKRLNEETTELDKFQMEVHAFREQVRELVSIF